jgi:hypothetical protein
LALADAGLGAHAEAAARLEKLIARHERQDNPLTIGALHLASAKVALLAGQPDSCRQQLDLAERCYASTGIGDLLGAVEAVRLELAKAQHAADPGGERPRTTRELLLERVSTLLAQSGSPAKERGHRSLQVALELTGADSGFILLKGVEGVLAQLGGNVPDGELVRWAEGRLEAESIGDDTALLTSFSDHSIRAEGRMRYCAAPLIGRCDQEELAVGMLVLGFDNCTPNVPALEVLYALAAHLLEGHVESAMMRTAQQR